MITSRVVLYAVGTLVGLSLLYAGYLHEPTPSLDILQSRVMESIGKNDTAGARRVVAEIEAEYPDNPRGPLLAGFVSEIEKDLESVERHYSRALALCANDEQRRDIETSLVDVERRREQLDAAAERLGRIVKQYGSTFKTGELSFLIAVQKYRPDQALSELNRLAEEHPGNARLPRLRMILEGMTSAADDARTHGDVREKSHQAPGGLHPGGAKDSVEASKRDKEHI